MKRPAIALAALLSLTACASPRENALPPPSAAPRPSTSATAPSAGEVDCRAIQTTGPDSAAFGLLLLALEGSPDADVARAAHEVMVAHVAVFDDPGAAELVEIPLATLRIRCQIAYPGI